MATSKQLPYETAQRSPENAEIEARKLLQKFGCDDIYIRISAEGGTTLAFRHKGLTMRLPLRTEGYYQALRKRKMTSYRSRYPDETKLRRQALISSWSLVLDWLKSNLTLVELNLMTFEEAFMSHVLLCDGTTVLEAPQNRLPLLTDGEQSATPEQIIDAVLE